MRTNCVRWDMVEKNSGGEIPLIGENNTSRVPKWMEPHWIPTVQLGANTQSKPTPQVWPVGLASPVAPRVLSYSSWVQAQPPLTNSSAFGCTSMPARPVAVANQGTRADTLLPEKKGVAP